MYIQTNIPFLLNVLQHPVFLAGKTDTYFIDENLQLFQLKPTQNRAQKLLYYLSYLKVNGPLTPLVTAIKPANVVAPVPVVHTGEKNRVSYVEYIVLFYLLMKYFSRRTQGLARHFESRRT